MGQLGLFTEEEVKECQPEPKTEVRLGRRSAQPRLASKRREALQKLVAVMEQLQGKDILVSYCGGSHSHWWFDDLRLKRLSMEKPWWWKDKPLGDRLPATIVLWGTRGRGRQAEIRIFTDCLHNVREQESNGGKYWLIDFWNGFGEYPINPYKPKGYESLQIRLAA